MGARRRRGRAPRGKAHEAGKKHHPGDGNADDHVGRVQPLRGHRAMTYSVQPRANRKNPLVRAQKLEQPRPSNLRLRPHTQKRRVAVRGPKDAAIPRAARCPDRRQQDRTASWHLCTGFCYKPASITPQARLQALKFIHSQEGGLGVRSKERPLGGARNAKSNKT